MAMTTCYSSGTRSDSTATFDAHSWLSPALRSPVAIANAQRRIAAKLACQRLEYADHDFWFHLSTIVVLQRQAEPAWAI
jgi:hypothetical protein